MAASLVDAVRLATKQLEGAYAIGVISRDEPDRLVGARIGSPLVVGIGIGENFLASDVLALRPVTDRFVFLEEGDLVEITANDMSVWSVSNENVVRSTVRVKLGQRRRRQGQLSPPHAEGDPRAAEGHSRHARRAHHEDARAGTGVRRQSRGDLRPREIGDDRRVRLELLYRLDREVLDRRHRRHAVPGRDRERVPISRRSGAARQSVRDDLAVWRNGRHAGGAAHGEDRGLCGDIDVVQRRDEFDRSRIGPRTDARGGSRNRRCVDQGVHRAAGRPRAADDSVGASPRSVRRTRSGTRRGVARPGRRRRGDVATRFRDREARRTVHGSASRVVPRTRLAVSGRARRRA